MASEDFEDFDTAKYAEEQDLDMKQLSSALLFETIDVLKAFIGTLVHRRHPEIPETTSLTRNVEILSRDMPNGTCQKSWMAGTRLIVHCDTCGLCPESCICLQCFLNGNHEGHQVRFRFGSNGNCDCGDDSLMKQSGFCSKHHGASEETIREAMSPDERKGYRFVFRILLKLMRNHHLYAVREVNAVHPFVRILNVMGKLNGAGDAMRRCCALEMGKLNFVKLLFKCDVMQRVTLTYFLKFLGRMINDGYFRKEFAKQIVTRYAKVVEKASWITTFGTLFLDPDHDRMRDCMVAVMSFLFHPFQEQLLEQLVRDGLDWSKVFVDSVHHLCLYSEKSTFLASGATSVGELFSRGRYHRIMQNLEKLALCGLNNADEAYRMKFLQEFFEICLIFERHSGTIRVEEQKVDDMFHEFRYCGTVLFCFTPIMDRMVELGIHETQFLPQLAWIHLPTETSNYEASPPFSKTFLLNLPAHFLAFKVALNGVNQYPSFFSSYGDRDEILRKVAAAPLRLFVAFAFGHTQLFVRNQDSMQMLLRSMNYRAMLPRSWLNLFNIVQIVYGSFDNISFMLQQLIVAFGIDSAHLDPQELSEALELFLHFLGCLIFDRLCLRRDMVSLRRLHFLTKLKQGPLHVSDFADWCDPPSDDQDFMDELRSYARQTTRNGRTTYVLTDDSEWHCLLPVEKYSVIQVINSTFMQTHPDRLLPFPQFEPEDHGLMLGRILHEHIILALIYTSLSNFVVLGAESSVVHHIHVQYLLNMLLQGYRISQDKTFTPTGRATWVVASREALVTQMDEAGMSFNELMYQPINFAERGAKTLYDLLLALGPLGVYVLDRMSIDVPMSEADLEARRKARKEAAEKARRSVIASFQEQARAILDEDNTVPDTNKGCSVCSEEAGDQVLCFPVYSFRTCLLQTIRRELRKVRQVGSPYTPLDREAVKMTQSFNLCLHLAHPDCANQERTSPWLCSIDRCPKNALLPHTNVDEQPTDAMREAMMTFMNNVFRFQYTRSVFALRSEIALLEIRQRARQEAADDLRSKTLIRHLFLTIHHTWSALDDRVMGPSVGAFVALLDWMLTNDSLDQEATKKKVKEVSEQRFGDTEHGPRRLAAFLRRAALVIHCVFGDITKAENWDEYLSLEALLPYFDLDIDIPQDLILPKFSYVPLPKNFIDFARPPYNIDMEKPTHEIYVSLFTGVVMNELGPEPTLRSYVNNVAHNTFFPCLEVSSLRASAVMLRSDRDGDRRFMRDGYRRLSPIYVDSFGEPDIGFARGRPLSLVSDEAIEAQVDMILSHRWIDCDPM